MMLKCWQCGRRLYLTEEARMKECPRCACITTLNDAFLPSSGRAYEPPSAVGYYVKSSAHP